MLYSIIYLNCVHVFENGEISFLSCIFSSNSKTFMYVEMVGWIGINASLNWIDISWRKCRLQIFKLIFLGVDATCTE